MSRFVRRLTSIAASGLALAALSTPPLRALDPHRRADQYFADRWTVDQGLPQETIWALAQTRDGYLWLGTQKGAVRFDGVRFTTFGPDTEPAFQVGQVKALLETADGALWIGVYGGGLVRYRDGRFQRFGKEQGLESLLVRALAPGPDGSVWVGTEGGVFRFQDGRVVQRLTEAEGLPKNKVRSLCTTRAGDLWIGTERGGAVRLRGRQLTTWNKTKGLLSDVVLGLHEDHGGDIWMATSWGVNRLHGDRVVSYNKADGLSDDFVYSVNEDRDGNVWAGTGAGGLQRFANGRFSPVPVGDGAADFAWAIQEDAEGDLWVGTEHGLLRLRNGKTILWGARQGVAADQVRGLRQARDGAMLIGTEKGLTRLSDGATSNLTSAAHLPSDYIFPVLEAHDGALWLGTDGGGVVRLQNGKATVFDEHACNGLLDAWALLEDRRGAIWAGTQAGGVCRFADGAWSSLTGKDGLPSETVRTLFESANGDLWIGSMGGGLVRFHDGVATRFTTTEGLGSNSVLALYEDADGGLWVGTLGGGLSLLAGGSIVTRTKRQGLFTESVGTIVEDDQGMLWMGDDEGVDRVARTALAAFLRGGPTPAVAHFGREDGLLGSVGTGFTPAAWKARDGGIWFSTSRGAATFDPRHLPPPSPLPPVLVEEISADHHELELHHDVVLPPGTFDLEIRYTAAALAAPQHARFRYRLEGFDRAWVDAGARRVAYYTNLPPGRFRFVVEAGDESGRWSTGAAALPLRLLPRFYQTWWFRALLALAAVLLAYGLYRLRVARIEMRAAVAEERNRLAREIHDTIAQDIAAILLQARTAQVQPAEAPTRLQTIGSLAEGSLAEARRSLLELRPASNRDLAAQLRESVEALCRDSLVEVEVRAEVESAPPPAVEAALMRIVREAVTNALRHARPQRIEVELEVDRREARLTVRDDGVGFDPAAIAHGHFGVTGMRERAQGLGGELAITSTREHGTEVVARLPLRRLARVGGGRA